MRTIVASLLTIVALASPAAAFAQDAGSEGYTSVLGEVGEVNESAPTQSSSPEPVAAAPVAAAPAPAPAQAEGTLPFTGADAGIVAGLGGLLIVAGAGLRRVRADH